MSLLYKTDDRTVEDDGFNLRNCGYAIVLVLAYVALVLVIGGMFAGHY